MKRLTLIAVALAFAASCTVTSSPSGPTGPSSPPPEESATYESPPPVPGSEGDTSSQAGASVSGRIRVQWRVDRGWQPAANKQWVEVGRVRTDPKADQQTMEGKIGREKWSMLAFRVENSKAPVDIYDVVLELGGGQGAYVPEIKHRFVEGENTVVIELPRDAQLIGRITFRYGQSKGDGGGVVVYGLPAK